MLRTSRERDCDRGIFEERRGLKFVPSKLKFLANFSQKGHQLEVEQTSGMSEKT
jgi:hypothetical protein